MNWDSVFAALPEPLANNAYVRVAILIVLALLTAKLVDWLMVNALRRLAGKTHTDLDDRLIGFVHRPIFISVLIGGLALSLQQLELPPVLVTRVRRVLGTVALLVWIVFVWRGCSILLDALSRLERRSSVIQPRTVSLFDQLSKVLILGIGTYLLFLTWGVDVGALLAAGGIVGIAVGFAAKDTLANFFSGIFIAADAPYKVGDYIVLDTGERGQVTQIGMRSTRLLTRDDIEVTIPNAVIANAKIVNESGGRWIKQRVRLQVGVAYGSDIDLVRRVLLEIASEAEDLATEPEPRVRFRAFGESSLNFELLGWIGSPEDRGRVLDALHTEVYKRFQKEGIVIPFPQRDIHLYRDANDL